MSKKPFYITTTLPYVNAEPHIGFAMELIRADIIARMKQLAGYDVFFNTGTDEHGIKIYRKAKELGMDTQQYVDGLAQKYKDVQRILGIMPEVNFIRTTDIRHVTAAQKFWSIVEANGYIYKKEYSIKYCVGCELEKTDSELIEGKCALHPIQELEIIKEENYFFKASACTEKLLVLYENNPQFVVPDFRFNEIKSLIKNEGLKDFSISRLASKMPWGVPVPGDESQVMYVWFDALVNYVSTIGWTEDVASNKSQINKSQSSSGANFQRWWMDTGGVVQYCGKDNIRQQAAMWQAMLIAAHLPPSKTIVINGFITGDGGIKMSKSLGNTVDPVELVQEYGTDAIRYFMARELSMFEDSPFTQEKFKESFNAHLANGIGNLTSRILKMVETSDAWVDTFAPVDWQEVDVRMSGFDIKKYCDDVWSKIISADKYIADNQPFKVIKIDKEKGIEMIKYLLVELHTIAELLTPILPGASATILKAITEKKMLSESLFMRK